MKAFCEKLKKLHGTRCGKDGTFSTIPLQVIKGDIGIIPKQVNQFKERKELNHLKTPEHVIYDCE